MTRHFVPTSTWYYIIQVVNSFIFDSRNSHYLCCGQSYQHHCHITWFVVLVSELLLIGYQSYYTEIEMLLSLWHFSHWLYRKLSKIWPFSVLNSESLRDMSIFHKIVHLQLLIQFLFSFANVSHIHFHGCAHTDLLEWWRFKSLRPSDAHIHSKIICHFDGLVQERCNSSALAMELRLSCIEPSICRL